MEEELTPTENAAEKFFQRFDFSFIPNDLFLMTLECLFHEPA